MQDPKKVSSGALDSGLRVVVLCCLLYLLSFFLRNSIAVIAPDIQQDLGFTPANISLISGSTMLAYGLMQLPSGLLADAFGGRRVVLGLLALAAIGCLVLSFSPGAGVAVGSRFLVGIGAALYVPSMALLASALPAAKYSQALGFLNASGGIGGILAATPMALLSQAVGWRGAALASAVLVLGVGILFFLNIKETAKPQTEAAPRESASLKAVLAGIVAVVTDRRFWPFCLWQMTAIGTTFMLITLWWIPYLENAARFSRVESSNIVALASIVMLGMAPLAAYLSNKMGSRRIPMIAASVGCVCTALVWAFLTKSMGFGLHLALALLFTISTASGGVLNFTMVRETFPVRVVGTASGCVNMIYPIWSALLQVIFGVMLNFKLGAGHDTVSAYSFAMLLVLANMVACLVCAFCMKETYVRD